LSVSLSAAIESNYGLQAVVDDQEELYVHDGGPEEAGLYQARFYFDPNSVEIPAEATLDIFRGLDGDTETIFILQLGMVNDDYAIRAVMLDDEQQSFASDWALINNAPHCLELEWWQAWSAEVSDGRMLLWIDENGGMVLQDVDNDTLSVEAVEMGAMSASSAYIEGTLYFDDFTSNRAGNYIGLDPNVTLPSPEEIFADGFESNDLSAWNSAETDGGDLGVTAGAALYDTYGLQAVVDDGSPLFVQDNSPLSEPHYRARFYFDPNSIYIPDDYGLTLLEGRDLAAGTVFRVGLRYSDDEYEVGATIIDDSQQSTGTDWTVVADEPHAVEVEWLAAGDAESTDGGLIFWVDGEEAGYIPWIDNDTHRVDQVRLGVPGMSSTSISGTLYIDDFVSHHSEYIGLNGEEERSAMQEAGTGLWTFPTTAAPEPTSTRTSTPTRLPTSTPTPTRTKGPAVSPMATLTPTGTPGPLSQRPVRPETALISQPLPGSREAPSVVQLEASAGQVSRTIDYTYDGLHRLTGADYDNGDYYAYTYDPVGNRLVLDSEVDGLPVYLEYTYDEANRLTAVGEVEYDWDDNGNLLGDGVNTYVYDSANRLVTVSDGQMTTEYGYNGLGERLKQTVDSQATEFVLDLNGGLSQVLSDGSTTYTYGLGRISQVGVSDVEYFLGDALGSVRQLTDAAGAITLARSYDPYGVTVEDVAVAGVETSYGFTNEYTDYYIKLINLRSRLYDPSSGRFLTRDSWQGNYNRPLSLNRWIFVEGNPINQADPSGQYASEFLNFSYNYNPDDYKDVIWGDPEEQALDYAAWSVSIKLAYAINNVLIPEYMSIPYKGLSWYPSMIRPVTPVEAFKQVYGGKVTLLRVPYNNDTPKNDYKGAWAKTANAQEIWIYLNATPVKLSDPIYSRWLTHELGHAFELAVDSAFSPNFYKNNNYYVRYFLFGDDVCSIDPDLVRVPTNLRTNRTGLHSDNYSEPGGDWQFNSSTTPEEIFADMFVAWTYDNPFGERGWATKSDGSLTDEARKRSNVMNTDMPIFIDVARWGSYNKGLWK
jgi:RHS repeat-associated protein